MSLGDAKATLYGREQEVQAIQQSLESVALGERGSGKVVLIGGNSGVGKTALAQKALQTATDMGFDVYRTACEPFHEGMSFFPVREVVRQVSAGRQTGELLAEWFGTGSPQAEMAAVGDSLNADPSSRREALVATVTNVILGRFQHPDARPILIFIDDMEHLDTGSSDALICMVSRFGEGRVLLLGAYRSDLVTDSRHAIKTLMSSSRRMEGTFKEVKLDRFSQVEFNSFIDVLLPGDTDLPFKFYDQLYEETEGNPLFTREVLRMLSAPRFNGEPGLLSDVEGVWRYDGNVESWEVPDTVEEVIASRLSFLDENERRNLESAAVIGRRFAFNVLNGLIRAGEDDLIEELERFMGVDIIRELNERDSKFEFSHGKIRDVLYDSLSGHRKRKIHGQVAEVYKQIMGSTEEDWDARIGDNLYKAGNFPEAHGYLLRAARNSQYLGNEADAVGYFRKALEASQAPDTILDDADSGWSIQLELAEALITASETDESAIILGQLTGPDLPEEIRVKALNLLGDVMLFEGEIDQAIETYEKSRALAEHLGDETALCEVLCDLAELNGRQYEVQAGLDPEKAAWHRDVQIASAEEAHRLLPSITTGVLRARILRNRAKLYRVAGQLSEAAEMYRDSINSADGRDYGHRFQIPYVKTLRRIGETAEALRVLERVGSWASQVGSNRSLAIAEQTRAMVQMTIATEPEELTEAQKHAEFALRTHRDIGYVQGIHEAQMVLGEIALRKNNPDEAFERFHGSIGRNDIDLDGLRRIVAAELAANGEEDRAEYVLNWQVADNGEIG